MYILFLMENFNKIVVLNGKYEHMSKVKTLWIYNGTHQINQNALLNKYLQGHNQSVIVTLKTKKNRPTTIKNQCY